MAAGGRILRVPGTLIQDPTDLSIASPYGGTRLGLVRDVLLLAEMPFFEVPTEDYGPAEWVEAFELGARFELRCSLRNQDNDAFTAIFPNVFTGASSSRVGILHPEDAAGRMPGAPASDRTIGILYAADNPANFSVFLRSAIPLSAARVEVPQGHTGDALWAVQFVARRAPSDEDGSFQWNTLNDISLTG